MSPITISIISLVLLVILIFSGVHIAFALASAGWLGVYLLVGNMVVANNLLGSTAYQGIRQYLFSVIPLFVLMGVFITKSGVAENLFDVISLFLKKIRGGMGIATILANAVFAAITGVSIASAAVFSKIAIPEMIRLGYDRKFSLGLVAGTSVLGMLIPPSLLFIVYGMVAELSIGRLFLAGVLPGLVLSAIFIAGIMIMSFIRPNLFNTDNSAINNMQGNGDDWTKEPKTRRAKYISVLPIFALIVIVLGGIWGGWFSPTEAGAAGAFGAFIIALKKLRFKGITESLAETAATSSTIFLLILCAQVYSRMLAMTGFTTWLASHIFGLNVSPIVIVILFCIIILLLGCILDSTSILLLTIPLMVPVIKELGFDPIWFGVVMVIAVEMGLITPPFGMSVFTVKASLVELEGVTVEEIFVGVAPFVIMVAIALAIVIAVPSLSTFLPNFVYG